MGPDYSLSRRGFLRRSTESLLAVGIPAWFAAGVVAAREAMPRARFVPANSRIALGLVGCGGRGRTLLRHALAQSGVEVIALCDLDNRHLEQAAQQLGPGATRYHDFRQLVARHDFDGVIIATPDHWHALVALAAMKAGKDVYCEKPLSLTIAESQALVKVARATNRVFQTGSQQRSDWPQFRLACELVRNHRLGQLKSIHTMVGTNPVGGPFAVAPVPPDLDFDFWLGPRPRVPYVPERCHYNFRWWYEYSGGKMTDWGAHNNDIAQWGLGADGTGPVFVEGTGTPPATTPLCYNCHHQFDVHYIYANGVEMHCTSEDTGVRFTGEQGRWIEVSRNGISASNARLLSDPLPPDAIHLEVSTDHMGNFVDCMRTRRRPICDVEVGHRSVSVCHIGVIALRTGKKLRWDPTRERFDDEEANSWLARPMRAPWRLEV